MLRQLRYYGGYFIRQRMRERVRSFLKSVESCRETQTTVLQRILRLNADSHFSRQRGLTETLSPAEFRRRVVISDFETVRPEVERLKTGQFESLLGKKNPLLMFALSSGTTGDSKYIPITSEFLKDYRRGWNLWGISAFDAHPKLHQMDIVQLSSDFDLFRTPAGIPCGNISGLVSKMQNPVVRSMYSVPFSVAKIKDAESKLYTALRLSVENPHVGLVMTANPSTLVQLAKLANREQHALIRDIADGTLSSRFIIPAETRAALHRRIRRPNRVRAQQLEQILNEHQGQLQPKHFWPNLQLAAVWTGGSASAYLDTMRRYYGDVAVRDHGLSASEGRMTIPFADSRSTGLLDIESHYFEFIPEAEYDSPSPTVLEAHELREGGNYYILLTTVSGLYRYNIRDVVRCCGFEGTTPLLEFLHKGASISNITGEKLTESQVVSVVREASRQSGIELDFFTLSPVWGDPPCYRLHVEEGSVPHTSLLARLARTVDGLLKEVNCEYQDKRSSDRLAPVECLQLPSGTWQRFTRHRQSRSGGSMEQYKHPCLIPALAFSEMLCRDFALVESAKVVKAA